MEQHQHFFTAPACLEVVAAQEVHTDPAICSKGVAAWISQGVVKQVDLDRSVGCVVLPYPPESRLRGP